jgi:hypothetical protein
MQGMMKFFLAVTLMVATLAMGCSDSMGTSSYGQGSAPPEGNDSGGRLGARPGIIDGGQLPGDATAPGPDAGADTADAAPEAMPLACPPRSTTTFTPPAYVPAVAHQGVCTVDAVAAFVSACADTNDAAAPCDAWRKMNVAGALDGGAGTACGNCIFAPGNNGAVWVDPAGFVFPNYGACMQLTDSTNGTLCATAYNNYNACNGVACGYCPTPSAPSGVPDVNDLAACQSAALVGGCNSFDAKLNACAPDFQLDGGAFFVCSPTGGSEDWSYIATLICGGASAAADASAPTD